MLFVRRYRLVLLLGTLMVIAVLTAVAPLEKTLGSNVRLIYLHGAWVWAGKIAFALAACAGLMDILDWTRHGEKRPWSGWSLALGRTGLVFWLTYLPLSLLVQQLNWGGIFWDEPRWRVPLAFGVAGVLLQTAILLFNHKGVTSLVNLAFGVTLWVALANIQNVLHPDSPIFGSGSLRIEAFFVVLVLLCLGVGAQMALFFRRINPA